MAYAGLGFRDGIESERTVDPDTMRAVAGVEAEILKAHEQAAQTVSDKVSRNLV